VALDKELMNKVYSEFGLTPNDVFAHKHYKIIVRNGIDKIQAKANIKVTYEPVLTQFGSDGNGNPTYAVIMKAIGRKYNEEGREIGYIETFGECMPGNNKNEYPVAMAEKRAMSRAVLKLAGLYQEGFFSEDEAEDFGESVRKGRNAIGAANVTKTAL
jgi:hypothetical protein